MIFLRKMDSDEVNNDYYFLVNQIYDLYKRSDGEFFEYEFNNQKRWLYRNHNHFTILGIEGEYIVYTTFMIDENYKVCHMDLGNFYASRTLKGEMLVWKENSHLADSLSMFYGGADYLDIQLDGVVTHHQVNSETGEEMIVSYRTMYHDPANFYSSMFLHPFYLSFIKDGKTKSYIRFTSEQGSLSYEIIALKENGISEMFDKGAYDLNDCESEIVRYFRVLHETDNGNCILLYPLSIPHTLEDLDQIIESKGFTRKIDESVLAYFNNTVPDKTEILALEKSIRIYCESLEKEKSIKHLTQKKV